MRGDPAADDAVWTDVLVALRWAEAATRCPVDLVPGAAWRTARACAATLARLPALCVVRGEAWPVRPVAEEPAPGSAAERLAAAALAVLAEGADWSAVR